MKKNLLVFLLLLASSNVFAWTIGPMNYQGRLLDSAGIPVTATLPFKVRIYDAASGGVLKFSEQHSSVAVDDGVYSFLVSTGTGSTGAWDIALWNTPQLFLEIEVNGETLAPRHLMAAAPYAFQANLALTTNNALALGGKPIEWFDSTLEAICVSSKGKWLELANGGAGACLGAGALFPGPTMVDLSTLTASTDLSNLDLTNADISGIDFGSADLSGSIFKNTILQPTGLALANFSGAQFDNVTSIGLTSSFFGSFANASISNSDLNYWSMYGVDFSGASLALLSGCPLLSSGYYCIGKDIGGFVWKYLVVGPGMNFSKNSLMSGRLNKQYTDQWSFNTATLTGINYSGNDLDSVIFPPYNTTNLSNSNFKDSNIHSTTLPGIMSGCVFDGATIKSSTFYAPTFAPEPPTFDGAELSFVLFNGPANDTVLNFTNAILSNIEIRGSGVSGYGQNISFAANTSRIDTLAISSTLSSLSITNSTVAGGINAHSSQPLGAITIGGTLGETTTFLGGNISGRFYNANFTGSVFYGVTFRGALLTGSTGMDSGNFINVDWFGAVCPDGFSVTTPGDTCIGHGI